MKVTECKHKSKEERQLYLHPENIGFRTRNISTDKDGDFFHDYPKEIDTAGRCNNYKHANVQHKIQKQKLRKLKEKIKEIDIYR